MKRVILTIIFLGMQHVACAASWTESAAGQEAFRDVQYNIDVSQYPASDPDFKENQQALKAGQEEVGNRFVTANAEPPIAYVVSGLDQKGRQLSTMFYGSDGRLLAVRIFSQVDYPKTAFIYCVDNCDEGEGKTHKSGELMSVSFHPSEAEVFYFLPNGQCTGHLNN